MIKKMYNFIEISRYVVKKKKAKWYQPIGKISIWN